MAKMLMQITLIVRPSLLRSSVRDSDDSYSFDRLQWLMTEFEAFSACESVRVVERMDGAILSTIPLNRQLCSNSDAAALLHFFCSVTPRQKYRFRCVSGKRGIYLLFLHTEPLIRLRSSPSPIFAQFPQGIVRRKDASNIKWPPGCFIAGCVTPRNFHGALVEGDLM